MARSPVKLSVSVGHVALVVGLGSGCFSLEELSSYRSGAPAIDTAGEDSAMQTVPDSDVGAADPSDLVEADAGNSASAAEAPDPSIGLQPATPADPDVAVAPACGDAAGEFVGLDPDTCYRLLDTATSWADARDLCQEWGGDLAEVTSAEESAMLVARLQVDFWLGANDLEDEGNMEWSSGAPFVFAPWADAQPDNFGGEENCLELRGQDHRFNDVPCIGPKLPLCERPFEQNRRRF